MRERREERRRDGGFHNIARRQLNLVHFVTRKFLWGFSVTMEELKSAMEEHMDLMADLVQKLSSDLRAGFRPAYDNFIGFFYAIDWKVALQF